MSDCGDESVMLAVLSITTRTTVEIRLCAPHVPKPPVIVGVKTKKGPSMAARVNTVLFSSPPPAGVISRIATVIVTPQGGSPEAPVMLDYVANPAATFPANDGDGYSITAIDSDSAGPSPVSNTFTGTITPPVSPPIAPVITGVSSV